MSNKNNNNVPQKEAKSETPKAATLFELITSKPNLRAAQKMSDEDYEDFLITVDDMEMSDEFAMAMSTFQGVLMKQIRINAIAGKVVKDVKRAAAIVAIGIAAFGPKKVRDRLPKSMLEAYDKAVSFLGMAKYGSADKSALTPSRFSSVFPDMMAVAINKLQKMGKLSSFEWSTISDSELPAVFRFSSSPAIMTSEMWGKWQDDYYIWAEAWALKTKAITQDVLDNDGKEKFYKYITFSAESNVMTRANKIELYKSLGINYND